MGVFIYGNAHHLKTKLQYQQALFTVHYNKLYSQYIISIFITEIFLEMFVIIFFVVIFDIYFK